MYSTRLVLVLVASTSGLAFSPTALAPQLKQNMRGCLRQSGGQRTSPAAIPHRFPLLLACATGDSQEETVLPPTPVLMLIAGLQSACFGCIGTALPPALRASGLEPAAVALMLGRIGSVSAYFEVGLSGPLSKLF